jgi:hypothetical protein
MRGPGVNTPEGSYWHAIVHRRWLGADPSSWFN